MPAQATPQPDPTGAATPEPREASANTIDPAEVARFDAMAEDWWNPNGPFRPLHQLNPLRIAYIRDQIAARLGTAGTGGGGERMRPLKGLRLLDVGCGGGLICEPMARLGASVVGIDAAARNIAAAARHAQAMGLAIDYRHQPVETLATGGERFDVILALEILEHVADGEAFLAACASLLVPGGLLVAATLNRTARSFAYAIVGAEYLLRWLPRGTHDWRRFIRPHELARSLRGAGLTLETLDGAHYDPLAGRWSLSRDLGVNYMAIATRPAGA